MGRIVVLGQTFEPVTQQPHVLHHGVDEDFVLGPEIEIYGGSADLSLLGYFFHGGGVIAVAEVHLHGGIEDQILPVLFFPFPSFGDAHSVLLNAATNY